MTPQHVTLLEMAACISLILETVLVGRFTASRRQWIGGKPCACLKRCALIQIKMEAHRNLYSVTIDTWVGCFSIRSPLVEAVDGICQIYSCSFLAKCLMDLTIHLAQHEVAAILGEYSAQNLGSMLRANFVRSYETHGLLRSY